MSNLHLLPTPATPAIPALELAKLLAHKLARITAAPAHVVDDCGHPMLASDDNIGPDEYWTADMIIFTAPAPV